MSASQAALSRSQVRALDERAMSELGVPGIVLMENAGRGAAEHVLALHREQRGATQATRVAIVCGSGNNGGDGYVCARHLTLAGCAVELFSACPSSDLRGDAALARRVVERMRLAVNTLSDEASLDAAAQCWSRDDVLVDALLGTGAFGAPRPPLARVIERFNAIPGVLRVALDLPSGLDCDSGEAPGACVRADLTVTFVAPKLGFANPRAAAYLGRVVVAGIGVPARF